MSAIPFTQYLLPDGRQIQVAVDRPDAVADKAMEIIGLGYRFECEKLTDGRVSLTIHDVAAEEDVDIRLVSDGNGVLEAVDDLVLNFQTPEATS